jgi:hypothetical protein
MTHDLNEPIPGAHVANDVVVAESRLKQAVLAFTDWMEPLQPHFAYGDLLFLP